jgi:hypothetical protein
MTRAGFGFLLVRLDEKQCGRGVHLKGLNDGQIAYVCGAPMKVNQSLEMLAYR